MRHLLMFVAAMVTLTACASSPPRAQRSEFEDIPVPKGLELDWSRSTIIESPTIKAARLFSRAGSRRTASPSHSGARLRPMAGDTFPPPPRSGVPSRCTRKPPVPSRS
jgi:hypothetical protein